MPFGRNSRSLAEADDFSFSNSCSITMASAAEAPANEATALIKRFKLEQHVEGGYFARTFQSADTVAAASLPPGFSGDRPCSSSILFLLTKGQVSHLHRIKSDEGWHHYAGDPLVVLECRKQEAGLAVCCTALGHPMANVRALGTSACATVGAGADTIPSDVISPCTPQHFVRSECWFGAFLPKGSSWALVGCTVAPGFDFAEFELADTPELQTRISKALCGFELSGAAADGTVPPLHTPAPGMQQSSCWAVDRGVAAKMVAQLWPQTRASVDDTA